MTAVTPANSATGVAVNGTITATFNQGMNSSTISTSTFTLTAAGGAAVSGTVSYSATGFLATFMPTAALANNTVYTATITTGAISTTLQTLAANYTWTFTTAAAAPVAPTVTAVTPLNNATSVAVSTAITATFSEAMTSSTISTSTFTLTAAGGAAVSGTVSYNSTESVATFTPGAALANNTVYTATITTGVQSSTSVALAANYVWTFTTVAASAPVAPTVTMVSPAGNAMGVAVNTAITATFSEAMDSSTITTSTFTLTAAGGAAVSGTVSYNSTSFVATFTPSAALANSTVYTASITNKAQSSAGTPLAATYLWTFTTVAGATAPTVANTVPAQNATKISITQALTATFSQQMNSATLTGSTFTLSSAGGSVSGLITYSVVTATATFTPSATLNYSTTYTATITTGATNSGGTPLASNYQWSFTTAANPTQVTVDFSSSEQTIRGFGGSTAWLGKMPQAVATALFDPVKGFGLSILRVRIDPEGSAASTNPYETGEWDYEAANGLEAVTANPNAVVFATPWTPPASMKNTSASQPYYNGPCSPAANYCGGYLDPSNYAAYASYLEDFVSFFNTTNGFNLYAISMQNEPEENVSYESCLWTPQQMDTWVANNASTITSDPYSTKLIMPEADSFQPAQALTALQDPNAEGLISIIGGHIYGVQPSPYSIPAGDTPKEIWMTEFGPLSTATPAYSDSLTYAESISNAMVNGQYNAYVWWGIFGAPTNAGSYGLVDSSGNPTIFGYAMGQFSKFIQPGYVRYDVTNPGTGLYISAYSGSAASTTHYVIVVINPGAAISESFSIENASVTSLTPYQTTSGGGLVPQSAITVTGGQFTYTLPTQSITTFVQ